MYKHLAQIKNYLWPLFIFSIVFFFGCKPVTRTESNILTVQNPHEETLYFIGNWDQGEGEFQWPGRCSDHGYKNYVKVDWKALQFTCHIAKFVNLNNAYYAHAGYKIGLYKGDQYVKTIEIYVMATPDEDIGDEPTYVHKKATRHFSKDITKVEIQQVVDWSYCGTLKHPAARPERKSEEVLYAKKSKEEAKKN